MMASSKMVVSTTNSDLPHRESSICSLSTLMADNDDQNDEQQSMTMDDILKNIYTTATTTTTTTNDMDDNNHHHAEPRTVDEVWKEIVAGGVGVEEAAAEGEGGGDQVRAAAPEEMTLEDFLTRAGAVREDDVTVGAGGVPIGYGQFQVQPPPAPAQGQVVYGNGTTTSTSGGGGGGGGGGRAGKRRAVQEAPLDKATQQKQRRMIKNRESAARSRERKQV